ncbi:MAG: CoA pyrophosphatase [Bacteroidota bacterium]
MNPKDLETRLKERFQQPLPGIDSQMEMAPSVRDRDIIVPDNARLSAVLMLLYPHEGKWYVPFMRRAEDGRVHGGQVSFPGGQKEASDPDFTYTALREAQEELGIPPEMVQVIGPMSTMYIPPSNFLIYPKLGIAASRPDFVLDPKEVQEVIEVDITELMDEGIKGMHKVDVFGGYIIQAPGYTVNEQHLIWGGTAMMIAELVAILKEVVN